MGEPAIPTPWIPPLDEPEPRVYLPRNDSDYRMKRNVSPVKRKVTSAVIVPGEINVTVTNKITPSVTPKPKKAKPRKMKNPQTTRPSRTVSFATSSCLETKSSKW